MPDPRHAGTLSPISTRPNQPLPIDYVLPLRWTDDEGLGDLTDYLRVLKPLVARIVVIDTSPPPLQLRHAEAWSDLVVHICAENSPLVNGKVASVHRGVAEASASYVLVADDDVRWSADNLLNAFHLLGGCDLLSPQNYFDPSPWHAEWDSARTLLNRALSHDYPGTLVFSRDAFVRCGGYRADVLFENLELMRTFKAYSATVRNAPDLLVRRLPATRSTFFKQRVRQAYDDFAQPLKAAAFLAVIPLMTLVTLIDGRAALLAAAAIAFACIFTAEVGRRQIANRQAWSWRCSLWAPIWFAERSLCIWPAAAFAVTGGMPYAGRKIRCAAHQGSWLAQRHTQAWA